MENARILYTIIGYGKEKKSEINQEERHIVLGLSKTLFWDVDPYSVDA